MKLKLHKLKVRMGFLWQNGKKSVKGDIIECYVKPYKGGTGLVEYFQIKIPEGDIAIIQCRCVRFYEAEIEPQTDQSA